MSFHGSWILHIYSQQVPKARTKHIGSPCISHLLRNALLSLLEVEADQVEHELHSFPMIIVAKKLQNLKKWPLSWGTTVVVNWNSLGHQCQAAVSGKGHKLWGLSLCRVAQHTSDNLQRAFTYLRRLENLKAETRQGGQRNAQCFTEHNGKTLACEDDLAFSSLSPPSHVSHGISYTCYLALTGLLTNRCLAWKYFDKFGRCW